MDYAEIAKTVIEFISIGIISGTLQETGKDIYTKTKGSLKSDELILLNLLEQKPESEDFKEALTEKLSSRLEENPEVAKELEELIKPFQNIEFKQNTMIQTGNKNIGIQDVSDSKICVK